MLFIRKEQMTVFQEKAERDFIASVVKQLRSSHEAALKDLDEDKIYKRVEYGIGRARKYGMTWKNNLTAFVSLMFEIAPDFDVFPVFQKYLTDETISPNDRMGLLLKETSEDDWLNAFNAPAQGKRKVPRTIWAKRMLKPISRNAARS
jgi:hypothetical protein